MIYNFGSISDLYNKIKLLTTRVTNTEAVDVTQNNRMTDIEAVDTAQNTRLTNVESVNTAQNNRLTTIENKLISSTKNLSSYISLSSGYSFESGSFIRMYGNVVDMYLIIKVNTGYISDTNIIGKIYDIRPYSSGVNIEFLMSITDTITTTFTINPSNGEITVTIPRPYTTNRLILHMTYII